MRLPVRAAVGSAGFWRTVAEGADGDVWRFTGRAPRLDATSGRVRRTCRAGAGIRSPACGRPHHAAGCTGHTILDEIRSRRVELVKELVRRDDCDRASLYCYSGFSSMIDLRRVFKALTGQTLSQWRAAGTRDAIMG